jgi:cytochrome c-type biogenesis protein CcmE
MKKNHILVIILLAISTAVIISTTYSDNTYADFLEASNKEGKDFTVVGNLQKNKPIQYNPAVNPNLVSFYMLDKNNKEVKVILNQSKPQDMERSEDVVVKGRMKEGVFYATSILLKCPSKYAEENKFTVEG